MTVTCQPPMTVVSALHGAWAAIREHHPDVPPAALIVGQGSRQHRHGLVLGHFAAERWLTSSSQPLHEVLIGGEGLASGELELLVTLLHEAAHGLALARDIQETSRQGRYHNHHFKTLANELGLTVTRHPELGWSTSTLPPATAARYQPLLAQLAHAVTLYRRPEPTARGAAGARSARCACPRRIRVAPGILAAGAIICTICDRPFTYS